MVFRRLIRRLRARWLARHFRAELVFPGEMGRLSVYCGDVLCAAYEVDPESLWFLRAGLRGAARDPHGTFMLWHETAREFHDVPDFLAAKVLAALEVF